MYVVSASGRSLNPVVVYPDHPVKHCIGNNGVLETMLDYLPKNVTSTCKKLQLSSLKYPPTGRCRSIHEKSSCGKMGGRYQWWWTLMMNTHFRNSEYFCWKWDNYGFLVFSHVTPFSATGHVSAWKLRVTDTHEGSLDFASGKCAWCLWRRPNINAGILIFMYSFQHTQSIAEEWHVKLQHMSVFSIVAV